MKRHRKLTIALGAAMVLLAGPALAQGMGGMGPGMGPGMGGMGPGAGGHGGMAVVGALCAKEIATHCAATPRGPEAWVCLNKRAKELSENCRTAVDATGPDMGPGTGPVARLCMAEIDKYCAGIEHGAGKVRDCLETRKAELGEGCKVALDNTGWGRRR